MKKETEFKPMLAGKCEDINTLVFPVLLSPKLDGVRAVVKNGCLLARSLKPIPNRYAQHLFAGLPEGTDGELILGDPTHKDVYRNTVSAVMSQDGEPADLHFYVFDNYNVGLVRAMPFHLRIKHVQNQSKDFKNVVVVQHSLARNAAEVTLFEQKALAAGYEGAMIRSPDGPYKFGRSTVKEGFLLKLKRFLDSEAEVIGTYELMHNENEAETNELGRTERSTKQDGLVASGILGGLEVRDIKTGVEFRMGTGFLMLDPEDGKHADYARPALWSIRKTLIGKLAKYRYFPSGSKDKPRFPVFIGWRDQIDL